VVKPVSQAQTQTSVPQTGPLAMRLFKEIYERIRRELNIDEYKQRINEVMKMVAGVECGEKDFNINMYNGHVSCIEELDVNRDIVRAVKDYLAKDANELHVYAVVTNYQSNNMDDISDIVDVERLRIIVGDKYNVGKYRKVSDVLGGAEEVRWVFIPIPIETGQPPVYAYLELEFVKYEVSK